MLWTDRPTCLTTFLADYLIKVEATTSLAAVFTKVKENTPGDFTILW